MAKKKAIHFFIVDDDQECIDFITILLEAEGHRVSSTRESSKALEKIIEEKPDCVLSDLTMPGLDGLELFESLKSTPNAHRPVFIIVTAKPYEYDQRRAFELGVDGYILKSLQNPEAFLKEILDIYYDEMVVEFWGVRGTLPVPGKKSMRYGGNTNCVTLSFSKKDFFIFDAGTGIKELSDYFLRKNKFPIKGKIFISHPHWDHINGIPFFAPFYMKGNEFGFFGSNHPSASLEKSISDQMNGVYFPIEVKEFAAKISYHPLNEEKFNIDTIQIQTILLTHPGRCLGYRVEYKGKVFCYITDNELYLENSSFYNQFETNRFIEFIHKANVMVIDATYTDEAYKAKINWGHSCISRVIDIADKAKVDRVCLYHHDPDQSDSDIDTKLKKAKELLKAKGSKTRCIAPHEGDRIFV